MPRAQPPVVTLPGNHRPLAPPVAERIEALTAHLHTISQGLDGVYVLADVAVAPEPRLTRLIVEGCTLCRGACCAGGGETAYLKRDTLARYVSATGRSPAQAVADYLAHVPAETMADSCVFHGAAGCGLPREMRADICNDYLCEPLAQLKQSLRAETPDPVLIVETRTEP